MVEDSVSEGNIFVLGSGTSEGVPVVSCLLDGSCSTCNDAQADKYSKNKRRNTSLAVQVTVTKDEFENATKEHIKNELTEKEQQVFDKFVEAQPKDNGTAHNKATIVIDIGKFFWQSGLDLFPKLSLRRIDAILITHMHIDAIGGFDDLRDWTSRVQPAYAIPVICNSRDFAVIKSMYPYLVSPNQSSGGGVSSLNFQANLEAFLPIQLFGLEFIPLPVYHGGKFVSLGFRFGDVVYISDCSAIPDCTTELIHGQSLNDTQQSFEELSLSEKQKKSQESLRKVICPCKILIIDCLSFDRETVHESHFKINEVTKYLLSLCDPKPEEIFFTGLCHRVDHEIHSKELENISAEYSLNIKLLYDGQQIPFHYTKKSVLNE